MGLVKFGKGYINSLILDLPEEEFMALVGDDFVQSSFPNDTLEDGKNQIKGLHAKGKSPVVKKGKKAASNDPVVEEPPVEEEKAEV
jgi:hypothetical protein